MRMIAPLVALTLALPVFADELPQGYVEIGRFTGTIDGTDTTLIATAHPEGENSDLEYLGLFDQYTIKTANGVGDYSPESLPWLEMTVQPDAVGEDTKTLRLDSLQLFTKDFFVPAYLAEVQAGYGTLALENLEARKDGYISFDFSADMPGTKMNELSEIVPDDNVPPTHIEGHFEGTLPEWEME